ncbi:MULTISPECIES: hypothetical protein [unclassified Nocardioides]|uniref:hypothetical protein n=1 Tax=unclassified Nocardioides TaxID=2615069 RepID=UPI0006FC1E3E|nr:MULTISPECIES: hypothetical protein [unclassified Nocardioides]KQY55384.1 hypothetical protein ASD30_15830 [Nocardioides sp. Root140]KQZ75508.1 hypothetical protein ASD66_03925 [Nocardioides sp. Root151]KRF14584.1 hypothetical protein ASH02_09715 [Nocardioides sp. Soil796]
MPALITRPNDFATALREAVERSGLCLENIQQRLAERGVEVSVATLSYWQSGNRVPGRKRSQMVVAHLESVLGLAPRSLRVLVPAPRPRGPVRAPKQVGLVPRFVEREAVRRIAEKVQAHSGGQHLTRISQHDVVRLDAARRIESVRIRTVARADADGLEGIGVTQFFEDRTAGTPWLTVHAGAEVASRHVDTAHRVLGTELRFAQSLSRGDTVVLDYEITADGPGPLDTSYDASCARAIREYVVEVHFPTNDLPEWVEAYHRPRDEGGDSARRVTVDSLGHAHYVVLDCAPGTTGLAWHY